MPTAETLALALEIAERDVRDARAALVALKEEQERQRLTWRQSAMLYIRERDAARAHLARIAASRARRDKRRAGKLAAARIRFLCPGGPVPVPPDRKPEGGGL